MRRDPRINGNALALATRESLRSVRGPRTRDRADPSVRPFHAAVAGTSRTPAGIGKPASAAVAPAGADQSHEVQGAEALLDIEPQS
jgi:hypothetical protein